MSPQRSRTARDAILAMGGYVGARNDEHRRRHAVRRDHVPHPGRRGRTRSPPARLGGLTTKVVAEQTQAVEVTGQVVDLEARIENLRPARRPSRASPRRRRRSATCWRSRPS